jgi:hypothetical protein
VGLERLLLLGRAESRLSIVLFALGLGDLAALADFGPGGACEHQEQGKYDETAKCLQSSHLDSLYCLRFAAAEALEGGNESARSAGEGRGYG